MAMIIIGGPGKMEDRRDDKPRGLSSKPKFSGGIGGKYSMDDSEKSDDKPSEEGSDINVRKRNAGKLLLRAINTNNPDLAAEAVTTLVNCCSEDGDGADSESEAEDSGEMD
jgi:hypothetical protein